MFDFSEVSLNQLVVHSIGNRTEEEGVKLSKSEMSINDQSVEDILKQYFLSQFKSDYFFSFTSESDLQINEVYNLIRQVFEEPSNFYDHSVNLAHLLYERSNHPKIKPGEFYMVRFSNVRIDDEFVDGIGLFKSETKDTFIRVYQKNESFEVDYDNGINIKKLDKGCLIFNTETELGFKVSIVDTTNRSNEAMYWRDEFLQIKPRENEFYQTNQIIDICKGFSDHVLTSKNNVEKQEQVAFMKRAEAYFNNTNVYDNEQFKHDIIGDDQISEAFDEFKQDFEGQRNLSPVDQFELSEPALKKGKKYFRSIIKLDKNFHIYVHSNPDYIETGFDNGKGLKYYKMYFHEES
ncbi:MAG: nucleoid-associated protein [Salinivirgaceae bacterium]|nr:nucleoid-associated protein [Salinivirgaceae bacterium]